MHQTVVLAEHCTEMIHKKVRPILFFSRGLNEAEERYSTIEREGIAIINGMQISCLLILEFALKIHTDIDL